MENGKFDLSKPKKHDTPYKQKCLTEEERKRLIVITKCLCHPCPILYSDVITGRVRICCKDPKHMDEKTLSYDSALRREKYRETSAKRHFGGPK